MRHPPVNPEENLQILLNLSTMSPQGKHISALLALIAGASGIIYGATAKQFTRHGKYTSREPEAYVPNWRDRLFVILISTVAVISSLIYLLKNS
jgi:hypothetical protein